MKTSVSVWFLLHVWSGLLNEKEPFVTSDRDEAFEKLKSVLQEDFGFRAAKEAESMEDYLQAFHDFEDRYRNDYPSITDEERAENIANDGDWNTDDNELIFYKQDIYVRVPDK